MTQKRNGLVGKLMEGVFRVSEKYELRKFKTVLKNEESFNRMPYCRAMIESKRYYLGSLLPVAQEMLFDKYLQIAENGVSNCLKEPIVYKLETLHKNRDLVVDFDERMSGLYNCMIENLAKCDVNNRNVMRFALYINHLEKQPNIDKTLFALMKDNITTTLNIEVDNLIKSRMLKTLCRLSDACSVDDIFPEVMNYIVSQSGRVRKIVEEEIINEQKYIRDSMLKEINFIKERSIRAKTSARSDLSEFVDSATSVLSKEDRYKLFIKLNANLG